MWKGIQYHPLLQKCKLKLQGGITSHQSECSSLKSLQIINARADVEKREPSDTAVENVNWYSHSGEQHGASLKTRVAVWSSNPTAGHISRENSKLKKYMHPMFIEALFTMARTRKQLKCSSTEEWIQKMWYIYTVQYYSATKRNEIMAMWMDLEIKILNEVSREWQISYNSIYMWRLKNDINEFTYNTEKDSQTRKQTYC